MLHNVSVRTSSMISHGFILARARSSGFGSYAYRYPDQGRGTPYSDSLSLRLRQLSWLKLCDIRKLVGSFFNRHTVTLRAQHARKKLSSYKVKSTKRLCFYLMNFINFPLSTCVLCTLGLRFLVSRWFQVLFHRPHRAAFHLSLTVLVHYRSLDVFSLRR